MQVVIRPFNASLDTGLIYSSYPKGVYYGSFTPIDTPKDKWFKAFYIEMQDQLKTSTVSIACMSDNEDVIIGYSIVTGTCLEFVYVKEQFRNQGIARLLLKNHPIEQYKNVTKVGHAILQKKDSRYEASQSAS